MLPPPLEKTLKLNINYSWILMYLCIIKIYFITINDLVLNAPVQSEKHEWHERTYESADICRYSTPPHINTIPITKFELNITLPLLLRPPPIITDARVQEIFAES